MLFGVFQVSTTLKHLLDVLAAILVRRLKIEEPLVEPIDLRDQVLRLTVQFLPQIGHRQHGEPVRSWSVSER